MEANNPTRELTQAVTRFVDAARRGMAEAFDATRVDMLRLVTARSHVRPTVIAEYLDLAPSSVTRHVKALEAAGLVQIAPDPADRRAYLIKATDSGARELRRFEEMGEQIFAEVVSDWTDQELRTLASLLDRLTDAWAQVDIAGRDPHAEQSRTNRRTPWWKEQVSS